MEWLLLRLILGAIFYVVAPSNNRLFSKQILSFLPKSSDVLWPSGKIPRDEPECGFDGSLCLVERTYLIEVFIVHFCF